MIIKALNTVTRKLRLLVSRAVVTIVSDAYKRQNLQVSLLAGEVANNVERFQNYGYSSVPPAGSEAIILSVGGKRQHLVAIAVEDKETRLKDLITGDTALYHMEGHHFLLTKDGKAMLVCKTVEVIADEIFFDTPQTLISGDVGILGSVSIGKNLTTQGVSQAADHASGEISGKNHVHRCPECKAVVSKPQ